MKTRTYKKMLFVLQNCVHVVFIFLFLVNLQTTPETIRFTVWLAVFVSYLLISIALFVINQSIDFHERLHLRVEDCKQEQYLNLVRNNCCPQCRASLVDPSSLATGEFGEKFCSQCEETYPFAQSSKAPAEF